MIARTFTAIRAAWDLIVESIGSHILVLKEHWLAPLIVELRPRILLTTLILPPDVVVDWTVLRTTQQSELFCLPNVSLPSSFNFLLLNLLHLGVAGACTTTVKAHAHADKHLEGK